MKDINGKQVKKGSILLEITGGGMDERGQFDWACVWEYNGQTDGSGYWYDIEGKRDKFWWACAQQAYCLDKDRLPPEFLFSFYHGLQNIEFPHKDYEDIYNIIEESNWKESEVKKEDVDVYLIKKDMHVSSIDDIKTNIEILKKGYMPHHLVSEIFHVVNHKRANVVNGESGIASMYDTFALSYILNNIDEITQDVL